MIDRLDLDRFRALAESYGGDIRRWPPDTQDAATAMARHPAAIAILEDASRLDAALASWSAPLASADLIQKSAAKASAAGLNFLRRARMRWAGIGIAAALSGAIAGTAATAVLVTPQHTYSGTIFGNLDDDGDN